ncbi:hypothetical protein BC828DRAFT_372276 [Blastocladiella britannica]|nr:hypothetical protein BC828DRAFT_372276 [Blastocladiella britannica]
MSRKSFLSLLAALVVLVLSVAPIGVHAQQCATMRTRKGLSQLSPTEWNSYVNGLHKMKANGALDRLTKRHREGMKYHGTPYFLLMHRALVLDFENELLAVSPGLQGTPYWDELREASGPKKSDVFTVPRLSPIAPGPLQGQFAGLRDDSGNLVTRNPPGVSPGVTWLPANQVLAQAMKGFTSFGQMSSIIEVSPHNQFHVLIGGHMGNPAISPSDPAFWTHHAYIDLLWALWQSLAPQNAMDLRTPNNNPLLKSADPVVLYPTKYTNRDMLLYRQRLCYQYTYPTQTPTKLKKRSAPAAAAAAEGGDTPSVNGCTSQYFTPLGAIPDSLVYQIMPNMSMTQWRGTLSDFGAAWPLKSHHFMHYSRRGTHELHGQRPQHGHCIGQSDAGVPSDRWRPVCQGGAQLHDRAAALRRRVRVTASQVRGFFIFTDARAAARRDRGAL